jgi:O-antigen/teichoic acid export membrane protein
MSLTPQNNQQRERALSHVQRLSVNAVLQTGGQVLPLLAGAMAIPIVYRNIGHADFGLFTLSLSAIGLFSLLDLGLGRASVRFMARAFAERDSAAAAAIFIQSAIALGGFSVILCLVLFALAPLVVGLWIHSQDVDRSVVRQCLYILATAVPFAGLTSVFRSVLEAREKFGSISVIQSTFGALTYLVPLALSFVSSDVRLLIAGAVLCRLSVCVAFALAAWDMWKAVLPWQSGRLRGHSEFRQFSFWTVLSNVIGTGIVYGDRAVLVRMFGLAEIPFYNVPLEMLGRMMIIVNSAATVVFPALSRVTGNRQLLDRMYAPLATLVGAGVAVGLLALSILTPALLSVWLGASFHDHSSLLVRIMLVGLLFQTLNAMALVFMNAGGFARPITLMHLAETPLYFGALYFCGSRFGLPGMALVWSARSAAEYACFACFQAYLATPGLVRSRRLVGAFLAASNIASLVVIASTGQTAAAAFVAMTTAIASVAWSLHELRGGLGGDSSTSGWIAAQR